MVTNRLNTQSAFGLAPIKYSYSCPCSHTAASFPLYASATKPQGIPNGHSSQCWQTLGQHSGGCCSNDLSAHPFPPSFLLLGTSHPAPPYLTLSTIHLSVTLPLCRQNRFKLAFLTLVTNQSQKWKNFLKFLGIRRYLPYFPLQHRLSLVLNPS